MKTIENYDDLDISALQKVRLYSQGRPLLTRWHRKMRGRYTNHASLDIDRINKELNSSYIAIDCAGWYFEDDRRDCIAIESHEISLCYHHKVFIEPDYLKWRPTYLSSWPVLAYYTPEFKYCDLTVLLNFCDIWSAHNQKLIIALDPTKVKFNYLKHDLIEIISSYLPHKDLEIVTSDPFHLLFIIT